MTLKPRSEDRPDKRVEVVLNPVKPGSRYEFVAIEQNQIPITNPFPTLIRATMSYPFVAASMAFRHWRSIALVGVCLCLAEFGLRTYEPRLLGRVYTNLFTGGYPVDMHPPGVRSGPVALEQAPGTLRVLACGDSVTFGTGVDADSTWPAHLERMLAEATGGPVEVINSALPGTDLRQTAASLDQVWAEYQPDRVVLVLTGNIISLGWIRRDIEPSLPPNQYLNAAIPTQSPLQRIAGFRHQIALLGAMKMGVESFKYLLGVDSHAPDPEAPFGVMLAHGYQIPAMDPSIREQAWAIFERDLQIFRDRTHAAGADLVVAYAPPRFAVTDDWRDNLKWVRRNRIGDDPIAHAARICDRLGIPFVDPSDSLRQALRHDWPAYVLADYTHLDDAGNRALARAISFEFADPVSPDQPGG